MAAMERVRPHGNLTKFKEFLLPKLEPIRPAPLPLGPQQISRVQRQLYNAFLQKYPDKLFDERIKKILDRAAYRLNTYDISNPKIYREKIDKLLQTINIGG